MNFSTTFDITLGSCWIWIGELKLMADFVVVICDHEKNTLKWAVITCTNLFNSLQIKIIPPPKKKKML